MSVWTYTFSINPTDKPLVWLGGEVKSPLLSKEARLEAGHWLRMLQAGHELRLTDRASTWRIFYRVDNDAVLILEVLQKRTQTTPKRTIAVCRQRAAAYDADS